MLIMGCGSFGKFQENPVLVSDFTQYMKVLKDFPSNMPEVFPVGGAI